ncbi:hypothetical protein P43SY_007107 [Pythium insidiosum]|uniref:EF-hand domain-containing protein n=1 Tax=Pythium insidiosum TaxID=114742 RepID=A0AAD5QA08_PYTIN|nr:hypothetical protein P43SY_007107 [Pythium insidiosum]
MARVRAKLLSRCGENGLNALHRVLALLDTSGDGVLSAQELKFGLRDLGVELSPSELTAVMTYLDKDKDGQVTLEELLEGLRGEGSLSPHRRALVLRAFRVMDQRRRGVVTLDDLRENYDVSQLPRVRAGTVSKAQALREFLREWEEIGLRNGETGISEDAYVTFYHNVSATIEDDGDFELLMRNTWHVTPEHDEAPVVDIGGDDTERDEEDGDAEGDDGRVDRTPTPGAAAAAAAASDEDDWKYLRSVLHRPVGAWGDAESTQRPVVPTLDDLCRRLGANRVWGDGNETMNTRAFSNALCAIDRRLHSKDALRVAEIVRAACCEHTGGDIISLRRLLHRLEGSCVGSRGSPAVPAEMSSASAVPAIIERIRRRLCQRLAQSEAAAGCQPTASSAGAFLGLNSLQRTLRIMDSNGDRRLSKDELRVGLQKLGVLVTFHELDQLFTVLDADRSGCVDSDEFLVAMRGDMNPRRLALVHLAFDRLDCDRDGAVTLKELRRAFDVSRHPEVQAGRLSADDALRLFAQQWDLKDRDGTITREEFEIYYRNVSASIDRDDYFELMMRNAWHISGGDGACANSSNRRVLVTDADGAQRVVEVKDDLGIRADEHERIRARLQAQGAAVDATSKSVFRGFKSRKWAALVRRQLVNEAAKRQRESEEQQQSAQRRILRAPLKAHYGF